MLWEFPYLDLRSHHTSDAITLQKARVCTSALLSEFRNTHFPCSQSSPSPAGQRSPRRADFLPQTWLNVVHEFIADTSTIKYAKWSVRCLYGASLTGQSDRKTCQPSSETTGTPCNNSLEPAPTRQTLKSSQKQRHLCVHMPNTTLVQDSPLLLQPHVGRRGGIDGVPVTPAQRVQTAFSRCAHRR